MKRTKRALSGIIAGALLSCSAAGSAAPSLRQAFMDKAVDWVTARAGVTVRFAAVSGNPKEGLIVEGLELQWPAATLTVARARLRADMTSLVLRRTLVTSLTLERPHLKFRKGGSGSAPPSKRKPASAEMIFRRIKIIDGTISWDAPTAAVPERITALEADIQTEGARFLIDSAQWEMAGREMRATGAIRLDPTDIRLNMRWAGDAQASLRWLNSVQEKKAVLRLDHGRRRALDAVWERSETAAWTVNANLDRLDTADLMLSLPIRLASISGSVAGRGGGSGPWGLAEGTLQLEDAVWGHARTAVRSRGDSLLWNLRVSTFGATAEAAGTARRGVVRSTWTAQAPPETIRALAGRWEAAFQASGTVSGTWPDLRWTAAGGLREFSAGKLLISSVSFSADGRTTRPFSSRLQAALYRLKARDIELGDARASISGSTAAHKIELDAVAAETSVSARGLGRLAPGAWSIDWNTLEGKSGRPFKNLRRFTTRLSTSGWSVQGLVLADRDSRLELDAAMRAKRWTSLQVKTSGLDPAGWHFPGLRRSPLAGVIDADLNVWGELRTPEGRALWRIKNGRWMDGSLGDISGALISDGSTIRIENLVWEYGAGRLTARGSVPFADAHRAKTDFDLELKAESFDPSPLALWSRQLDMGPGILSGNMRLGRIGGAVFCKGEAVLRTESIRFPSAGVAFSDALLSASGDGAAAISVSGRAVPVEPEQSMPGFLKRIRNRLRKIFTRRKTPAGEFSVTGRIDLNGPDLRLTAQNLPFRGAAGLAGEAELAVDLGGAWKAPRIGGLITLTEAELAPSPQRMFPWEKPALKKSRKLLPEHPYELDLKLQFDRNAWYRQGGTNIEFLGELLLKKDPGGPVRLLGSVRTIQGQYAAYGRPFAIQEGHIAFKGAIPHNPDMEARAVYVEDRTRAKIFLDLKGPFSQPRLTLTSEPPLEQRDIIALLTIGRPLHDLAPEDSSKQKREDAVRIFTQHLSQEFHRHVLRRIRIDTFNVRARGFREADISAGKYLTKKLFVTYGQTLGPVGQRRLESRYALSPAWSLEGRNCSDGRHVIDLFRNFSFE